MTARQPTFIGRVLRRLLPRRQTEQSSRQELLDAFVARLKGRRDIHASYDAAQDTDRMFSSTLTAAEAASLISILLKTQLPPDDGPDGITTGSALEFLQGMMVAAPMGWDFQQLRAEHPNATFESFMRALVGEQGRPKQMPYNIAACDSSSYEPADL